MLKKTLTNFELISVRSLIIIEGGFLYTLLTLQCWTFAPCDAVNTAAHTAARPAGSGRGSLVPRRHHSSQMRWTKRCADIWAWLPIVVNYFTSKQSNSIQWFLCVFFFLWHCFVWTFVWVYFRHNWSRCCLCLEFTLSIVCLFDNSQYFLQIHCQKWCLPRLIYCIDLLYKDNRASIIIQSIAQETNQNNNEWTSKFEKNTADRALAMPAEYKNVSEYLSKCPKRMRNMHLKRIVNEYGATNNTYTHTNRPNESCCGLTNC